MARVEQIDGMYFVVRDEVPDDVVSMVEERFPGMGDKVFVCSVQTREQERC